VKTKSIGARQEEHEKKGDPMRYSKKPTGGKGGKSKG